MNKYYLGIDTSNYTTSAALCDSDGNIVLNFKVPVAVAEGERGVRQAEAVFAHIKAMPTVSAEIRRVLEENSACVAAVGVSLYPRDAENSYMPCFLSGKAVAEMTAAVHGVPLFDFSHQAGHIRAALYSAGAEHLLAGSTAAAFHVSGGTTELVLLECRDGAFSARLLGGTADISAGKAIDRVGVMMGMRFPAGPALEAAAMEYRAEKPKVKISCKGYICNLSGVENLAARMWEKTHDTAEVASFVFTFIGETLAALTKQLTDGYGEIPIVYSGGVMSSRLLRDRLNGKKRYFAEPAFSADNAAGIALLTYDKMKKSV